MTLPNPDRPGGPGGSLRLGLLASDPGLVRLRLALRTVLTVMAVCTALLLLHRWLPMPPAAYALAMITAIQGTIAIKDPTVGARAVSRAYAAGSGFLVIAAISLLDHSLLRMNLFLLLVIFLAVYARRFGPRWQGVGMFAFMCGVIGAFLKAPDSDLADIALALALSGIVAHLVRNFVMPDDPMRDFQRTLAATVALSRNLHAMVARKGPADWTPTERRRVLSLEGRSRDLALLCQSMLPATPAIPPTDACSAMAAHLYDLHLAMESAVAAALRPGNAEPSDKAAPDRALAMLSRAADNVAAMATRMPAAFPAPEDIHAGKPMTPSPARAALSTDPILRQAVQVTLASGIAMVGGFALSPERWFWAVLTAFLIFTNTQSLGDVAIKGLNRALGTALGICFGIGLATLLHGRIDWTLPLVAVSIFLAFYLMTISYGAMTFFITITISLVYGLIGVFTPELLVLRLEETMIGSCAGIFVSIAVLPWSTSRQTAQAIDGFMMALGTLLDNLLARRGATDGTSLLAAAAALETARARVYAAADPQRSPWTFGLAQGGIRRILSRSAILAHAGRLLARDYADTAPGDGDMARLKAIRAQLSDLADHGCNLAGRSTATHMARLPESWTPGETEGDVAGALDAIEFVLHQAQPANQER